MEHRMPTFEEVVKGVEGLSEESAKALTDGFADAIKLAGEKSESDISELRKKKDDEIQEMNRKISLLEAEPGAKPSTEAGQTRDRLQAQYDKEDAEKAKTSAVNTAVSEAQAMWQAKADASAAGVPDEVVAATTTLGELSIATAMYKSLKPADNKEQNPGPVVGAGRRGDPSNDTGRDAGEVMLDYVNRNLKPMGHPPGG